MLTRYLFPHRYKRLGWVLIVFSLTLGLLEQYDVLHLPHLLAWLPSPVGNDDLPDLVNGRQVRANHDLYALLLIVGGLLVTCSRERHEDEYIGKIRLDALLWALYSYYALLLLAFVLVSGVPFLAVMQYALFAPLLLFVALFQVLLLRSAHRLADDE
jgi:hypothetical protein